MENLYKTIRQLEELLIDNPGLSNHIQNNIHKLLGELIQQLDDSFFNLWGGIDPNNYDELQNRIYNLLFDRGFMT